MQFLGKSLDHGVKLVPAFVEGDEWHCPIWDV